MDSDIKIDLHTKKPSIKIERLSKNCLNIENKQNKLIKFNFLNYLFCTSVVFVNNFKLKKKKTIWHKLNDEHFTFDSNEENNLKKFEF